LLKFFYQLEKSKEALKEKSPEPSQLRAFQ